MLEEFIFFEHFCKLAFTILNKEKMDSNNIDFMLDYDKMYDLVNARMTSESFENMGSDLMTMILDLYQDDNATLEDSKFNKITISQVLAYLQASHKWYFSKKIPEIEQSMIHIFDKYGESHKTLSSLTAFFNDYKNRFISHIRMEEKEFFPYIKKLVLAEKGELSTSEINTLLSLQSLEDFNDNHDPIEDDLQEVSKIIHRHSDDKDLPLPYRVFLNQVEIFELELRKHAYIEDFVLVPLAQKIEDKLKENRLK